MKREQGFSLIELLIVVAILLVIAAIAIPSLLRSRLAANEASAVGSLHALNNAEITFSTTYPNAGYACTLAALGPVLSGAAPSSTAAGLIDANLASGMKSGYSFAPGTCNTAPTSSVVVSYQWAADPITPGSTGTRHFCTDGSITIKWDASSSSNCLSAGTAIGN